VPKFLSSPARRSPSSTSPSCTGTSGERETSGYSIANILLEFVNQFDLKAKFESGYPIANILPL
jgi:hypothetical protein